MKIGIYLNSGDVNRDIPLQIKKLRECKAARANLWIESPDGRRASLSRLTDWADALRAADIEVCLWTFPNAAKAREAGEYAGLAAAATQASMLWLDIERPPPGSPAKEWTPADAKVLIRSLDLHADVVVGVTSYPVRSNFERLVPLSVFEEYAHGAPQLYRSASVRAQRERAIAEWQSAHRRLTPIVGAWLGNTARLDADIAAVTTDRFYSFDVWVLGVLDRNERAVLAQWADK